MKPVFVFLSAMVWIGTAVGVKAVSVESPPYRSTDTCLPPTPAALRAVTSLLRSPEQVPWFQARGITATRAEDLTPLHDPSDIALCRKLDSLMAWHPAYYFRAGSYVLATSAAPLEEDSARQTVTLRHRPGTTLIFDSSGTYVRNPYSSSGVIAPTDLGPTESMPGRVVLTWTNRSTGVQNYRVQRATGGGGFVNRGQTLIASAVSAIDTAVTNASTYQYRLMAIGTSGDTAYSNVFTVAVTDIGVLERVSSGLLFRDQFDRANGVPGASWVVESGNWRIVDQHLLVDVAQGSGPIIRLGAMPARRNVHVQWQSLRTNIANYQSMYVRRSGNTLYLADLGSTDEGGGRPRMYRQTAGTYALLGYGAMPAIANTEYRLTFSVIGTSRRFWSNGASQVNVTDATVANDIDGTIALNAYGAPGSGTARVGDVIVCSDRSVVISGLPVGYRFRVSGLMSAPATAGASSSIDLLATKLPAERIEILNPDLVVVRRISPSDGVWGGDRYSLNGVQ